MGPVVRAYANTKAFPAACELKDIMMETDLDAMDDDDNDYMENEEVGEVDSVAKVLRSLNLMM